MILPIIVGLISLGFTAVVLGTTWHYITDELFHPVVLLNAIMGYYIIAPAWFLLLTGRYRFEHSDPLGNLALTLVIAGTTYALILAVYYRTEPKIRVSPYLPDASAIDRHILFLIGAIGFAAGVVFYLYYVRINGGFVRLLTITPRTAFSAPDTARYKFLAFAGIFAGMMTILTAYRPAVRHRRLSRRDYAILGSVLLVTFLITMTLRSRMNIVIPVAYILLYAETTGRLPREYLLGGAGALFFVGTAYTFVEALVTPHSANLMLVITAGVADTIRLEVLMKIVHAVPESHPYQWGATFVHALGIRWPEMPMSYGNQAQVIATDNQRDYVTFPALMLGELYLNFGVIGTLIGGGVFGWLLKQTRALRNPPSARTMVAGGLYPIVLLGVVAMLPTSIQWGFQSIGLRIFVPFVVAIIAAAHFTQRARNREWPWSMKEKL